MKVSLFVATLLAGLAIAWAALGPASANAQQNVCQTNPSPVDAADPSVIVDEPAAGASVTSPLHVEGQARVFEATVSLTLFDEDGTEIVSTVTNAAEGQTLSPFSTDVAFTVTEETPACLWVFEASAEDGSPVNVVQVPLTLEADDASALPPTGVGGDAISGSQLEWLLAGLALAGAVLIGAGSLLIRRPA